MRRPRAASPFRPQPLGLYRLCLITPDRKTAPEDRRDQGALQAAVAVEIESYLASGQWRGKAGGYGIQGFAGTFVEKLVGSYTNVVGLPLYETVVC